MQYVRDAWDEIDDHRTLRPFDESEDDWRPHAACIGVDTNVFFPEKGCSKHDYARAKKICQSCTVSQQCGDYAMQWDERYMVGIWGGMTGIERRAERNKRNTEDNRNEITSNRTD